MTFSNSNPDRRTFMGQCLAGLTASVIAQDAVVAQPASQPVRPMDSQMRSAASRPRSDPWADVPKQFLLDPELAYFNTGGLGPSPLPVIDAVNRSTAELERVSETGREKFDEVRRRLCLFLNCEEEELGFTGNTTEGINIVARGLGLKAGDEVLLTTHEHVGGAMPWFALAQDEGVVVKTFEPGSGGADTMERLASSLTPKTRVVSMSHITCTTGAVMPIRAIARVCHDRKIILVVDGAQAVGMIPVDLHFLGCQFYATSGHKWLLGPKGTGLLYVNKNMLSHWHATYAGAYADKVFSLDEGKFERLPAARSVEIGTRNASLIVGLGAAVEFLNELGMDVVARHGWELTQYLRQKLQALSQVEVLTPEEPEHSASILTFQVDPPIDPGEWANRLSKEYHVRVRPVTEHKLAAIRVCAHVFNDVAQMDRLVAAVTKLLGA
ncbi:MAG TPA: aminotransferase class V-fold PLP-dependent enzyme [Phycisphaerae bacterium]|nr:aminotransferase class V-fold PLP-dependent enzyme [Phycisphaerae bacterium]